MRVVYLSKKWLFLLWLLLGIVLLLLFWGRRGEETYAQVFASPARGRVVVLDAGHGGMDPGAVGPGGAREDTINLSIARQLRTHLQDHGAVVVMTRDSDQALASKKRQDMQKRVQTIRDSGADIVVSIHLNKFPQAQYYGAQTFYMEGSTEGKKLAQAIQTQLLEHLGRGNKRQIKSVSNLLILKAGSAPAVIVECGFLSNPEEAALLVTKEYQAQIAWAIYSGILRYFAETVAEP